MYASEDRKDKTQDSPAGQNHGTPLSTTRRQLELQTSCGFKSDGLALEL